MPRSRRDDRTRCSILTALLLAAACQHTRPVELVVSGPDAQPVPAAERTRAESPSESKAPEADSGADEYGALLLEVQACPAPDAKDYLDCTAVEIVRNQPALEAKDRARTAVALEHLRHTSAAVRYEAARALCDLLVRLDRGDREIAVATRTALIVAVRVEADPEFVEHVFDALGRNSYGMDTEIDEVLWSRIDDADPHVRATAVYYALDRRVALDRARIDRAFAIVERDSNDNIRGRACEMLGRHPDPAIAARLVERITDPKLPAEVSRRCFDGLVGMWNHDAGDAPSEAAFDATLALMRAKPRDLRRPYFYHCGSLVTARHDDSDQPAWYAPAKVTAALADIVLDRKANAEFRTLAAEAIVASGDEGALASLRKAFAKPRTKHDRSIAAILAPPPS